MPVLRMSRRERFARLVAAGATVEAAYRAAGYRVRGRESKYRTLGNRLLAVPEVNARVAELSAAGRDSLDRFAWGGMPGRGWVIARLMETAERALQTVPMADRKGIPKGEYAPQGTVALRALELLGRDLGMFDARNAPPIDGGVETLSDDELERRAGRLAEALGFSRAGDGD